jgi:hypothetical protein
MPVNTIWDDEAHTTLRVCYRGRWTFDEVRAAFFEVNRLANSANSPLSLLLHHEGAYVPPHFAQEVVQSDNLPVTGYPEAVVFIGNRLLFELYELARRPLDVQGVLPVTWVATLDEAREVGALAREGRAVPAYHVAAAYAN